MQVALLHKFCPHPVSPLVCLHDSTAEQIGIVVKSSNNENFKDVSRWRCVVVAFKRSPTRFENRIQKRSSVGGISCLFACLLALLFLVLLFIVFTARKKIRN